MSVTNSTNSRTSSRHPKPLLGEFLDVRLRYGFSLACGKYIRIQTERQSIQSFYFISHCLQGYFLIDWFNMALQIFLFWSFIFKLITRVLDFLDWFNMFLSISFLQTGPLVSNASDIIVWAPSLLHSHWSRASWWCYFELTIIHKMWKKTCNF